MQASWVNRFWVKTAVPVVLAALLSQAALAQINKEYFFVKGTGELIDHKYPAAIESFNVLIKVDTGMYEAYFRRAIAKYNLSDFIGALYDFDKAIRLNPVFTYAYFYRAITHNSLGRHSEALKDLEAAGELRPELPGIYYSRALSYFFLQQFDSAIKDFDSYLRYEPKASEGYVNRGTCKLFLKDTLGAIADYNHAIAISRYDANAYSRRGRVYAMQGNNEAALGDFDEAVRLDTASPISYYFRAIALYNTGNINAALRDFDKVLALDPYNALTMYNRALMLAQIGSYDSALESYTQAVAINPGNVLIYYNRAAIYLEKQMPKQAIADYDKAIELYPDFANAYLNRSYAKRLLGNARGAKQDYETATKKIADHQSRLAPDSGGLLALADTSQKFNQLVAFDADFGNKSFTGDMLQYRRADITLLPLFRLANGVPDSKQGYDKAYFNAPLEQLKQRALGLQIGIASGKPTRTAAQHKALMQQCERLIDSLGSSGLGYFAKASLLEEQNQYAAALTYYKQSLSEEKANAFYHFNRSVAQSEMVDFISSIDNSPQTIVLETTTATTSVHPKAHGEAKSYSYGEAIDDLRHAIALQPDFAHSYYNLGNLQCQSNQMPDAIDSYTQAIARYPSMAEAYYNRGLVQIYLHDTEKGCLDISKAGELGVKEAYNVIKRFCIKK